ncbi:MAG: SDR family oxidoreductase [Proteobacteria bacterium]|nr:MAG: SDR family oxidoreductase [Pseudomonadota bacterium]
MELRPRILILGGTGMLGHELWRTLTKKFQDTWVTVRSASGVNSPLDGLVPASDNRIVRSVDVADFERLHSLFNELNPTVIINAVAVTKRNEGEKGDPASIAHVLRINAELPHQLASWAKPRGVRVIHFSTDCVFNGDRGGYSETDVPDAMDLYGRSKLLGEIDQVEGNCITLRTSLIGRELARKTELLEWFLGQKGKSVRGYRNAVFSGVATWVMADLVISLIEKNSDIRGVFQIAAEPIDKFTLLQIFNDVFKTGTTIAPEENFVCKRNLDGSKFRQVTGWIAPSWKEMVHGIANGK